MTVLNLVNFDKGLKHLYPKGLTNLWIEDACPFVAWLPKTTGFVGRDRLINPILSNIQGAADFATALANKGIPTLTEFRVTRTKEYLLFDLDNETVMATKDQKGALRAALKTQIDAGMNGFARAVAHQVWGNGGGARGEIASIAGDTVVLSEPADIVHYEIGMILQTSADDGVTASSGVRAGTVQIAEVTSTGFVVVEATVVTGIAAAVAGDFLYRQGDYQNVLAGVKAWIPDADPTTGDSHFGVDRSIHVNRLAGSRYDLNGSPIEDGIFQAVAIHARNGGRKADCLWMNAEDFATLQDGMNSKAWIDVKTDSPTYGIRALGFHTANGVVKVMSDTDMPKGKSLLTNRDSWELASLGEAPHFAKDDGLRLRTSATADTVEGRLRAYWQLINKRPVESMLITL